MSTQIKTLIGVGIGFLVAIILVCIGLTNDLFIKKSSKNTPTSENLLDF